MALQTQGFALSSLGHAPDIPANVGKIDVGSIYDRITQGLQTAEALRTAAARQRATDADLLAQREQAPLRTSVLASQAALQGDAADISGQTLTKNILAKNAGLDEDLIAEQNKRDSQKALATVAATMNPAQRVVFDRNGPATTTNVLASRQGGNAVSTATKTENVGGVEVPVATSTSTAPAGPLITPLMGVNGQTAGAALTTMGPDGKQTTSHFAVPQTLLRQNTGLSVIPSGVEYDLQTGQPIYDKYVTRLENATGGFTLGKEIKVPHGSPPPLEVHNQAEQGSQTAISAAPSAVQAPSAAPSAASTATPAAAPIAGGGRLGATLHAKDQLESLNELAAQKQTNDSGLTNVARISDAVEAINKDSLLPNFISGKMTFLPSVQQLNSAVSQFASDIVQKFKGAGRVTQQEVNFAGASYPQPGQAESVQRANVQYLQNFINTVSNRTNAEYDLVKSGVTPADAKVQAINRFPIPPPPGASAGTAQAPAAQGSQITSQAEFDALPSGATFIFNGKKGVKH